MEFILVAILEILGEFLVAIVFELVGDAIGHQLRKKRGPAKERHWLGNVLIFTVIGAVFGGVSLLVFPHLMLGSETLRIVNLVMTPIAAGAIMAAIGAWRRRHEKATIPLDTFFCGYVFALAMALVRFFAAP